VTAASSRARGVAARTVREPLVHFLLLGAALFVVHGLFFAAPEKPTEEIVVRRGRIDSLAQGFAQTWQRPPSAQELEGLVEDYVREEVLYREALALGLDRDDTVVRRRLRQKLEFISDGAGGAGEPTEEELAGFLAAHAADYRVESRLTFSQVFLDPSKRGAALPADAAALLAELRTGAGPPAALGDGRMLASRYEQVEETEIARLFGSDFEAALRDQPVGAWLGPLQSGYGVHLVRIEARAPGRAAELAEVREAVARDWAARRRQEALDAEYRALRSRYRIRVEGASPPASPPVAAP
jgi:PPIC-type PPIASE domain